MREVIRRKLAQASARPNTPPAVDLDDPKLTAEEAAAKLGISASTMRQRFGRAPGVIRIGGCVRWPASVVRRIIEAHTVAGRR
jgi:predicted DNA-binding transcriptional regulator AlpA